jgi:DNA-binding CsgD family transcriptional regulator
MSDRIELPAPGDLRVSRFEVGSDEYMLVSYPLPEWNLPRDLTPAEAEVALASLRGASRAQIARDRGCSERTVANLLARVFEKLGVSSKIELACLLAKR